MRGRVLKKTRASSLQSQNHFQLKLSRFISISYFANICSNIVEGDVDVDTLPASGDSFCSNLFRTFDVKMQNLFRVFQTSGRFGLICTCSNELRLDPTHFVRTTFVRIKITNSIYVYGPITCTPFRKKTH